MRVRAGGAPPRANFISVLCLASPDGETQEFEGKVFGHLVWPPRGGNGFGYDPMFVPDGDRDVRRNGPKGNTRSRIAHGRSLRSRRRCLRPSRPRPLHPRPGGDNEQRAQSRGVLCGGCKPIDGARSGGVYRALEGPSRGTPKRVEDYRSCAIFSARAKGCRSFKRQSRRGAP